MAKIDEVKEEINYLKVWLGIIVVTAIGLLSWIVNNYDLATNVKNIFALLSLLLLSITIIAIDRKIKKKIKTLKDI